MTHQPMPRQSGYVGRTSRGDRLWLEIELRQQQNVASRQTVEHEPASESLELSISGLLVPYRARTVHGAGQVTDDLKHVTEPAEGWTVSELRKLLAVWERWHLNGLKAGCVHMPEGTALGTECPVQAADPKIEKPYRYGHAWLVEVLPDEVEAQVRAWAARLDGTSPIG